MKTKEEIDELYHKLWDDFSNKYDDNLHYYSFVEGYTQCQEDMVEKYTEQDMIKFAFDTYYQEDMAKKYTEEDIRNAIDMARMLSHVACLEEGEHRIKYSNTEDEIINSLNKQDNEN